MFSFLRNVISSKENAKPSDVADAPYTDEYLSRHIFRRIVHFPGQAITYVQNPKVACTSIETSLWAAYEPDNVPDRIHKEKSVRRPYFSDLRAITSAQCDELLRSEFFTVVRNPYARFLSAYSNKVQQRQPWAKIHRRCGFVDATRPSMSELLERLRDLDPAEIDHHFRPQHLNVLYGFAPLSVIGHLEHFSHVANFLSQHDINVETRDEHATNAALHVRSALSDREMELIGEFYKKDFEIFRYSSEVSMQNPDTPIMKREPAAGPLAAFLTRHAAALRR